MKMKSVLKWVPNVSLQTGANQIDYTFILIGNTSSICRNEKGAAASIWRSAGKFRQGNQFNFLEHTLGAMIIRTNNEYHYQFELRHVLLSSLYAAQFTQVDFKIEVDSQFREIFVLLGSLLQLFSGGALILQGSQMKWVPNIGALVGLVGRDIT